MSTYIANSGASTSTQKTSSDVSSPPHPVRSTDSASRPPALHHLHEIPRSFTDNSLNCLSESLPCGASRGPGQEYCQASSPLQSRLQPPTRLSSIAVKPNLSSRRCINLEFPDFYHSTLTAHHEKLGGLLTSIGSMPLPQHSVEHNAEHCKFQATLRHPLTPPSERDSVDWSTGPSDVGVQRSDHDRKEVQESSLEGPPPALNTFRQSKSGLRFPTPTRNEASQNGRAGAQLAEAIRCTTEALEPYISTLSAKVVSQVMPSHAIDHRPTKTYEAICENLQNIASGPRYISISHALALSDGQGVQDFPKSPPATPNNRGGDSYFGQQTVFTHVVQIPLYHNHRKSALPGIALPQRGVMPAEANVVILERYIPPTTAGEVADIFDPESGRSYLADRMPELAENGSLLFIYPTSKGSATFSRSYVGPVLDPLLRSMAILRNLRTDAAERLGVMQALNAMLDFDSMKRKMENFCTAMNAKPSSQTAMGTFHLVHSSTAETLLDRKTWLTWFVDQEQQRFKQDLIEYHKNGGELPQGDGGATEMTAGMLAREVMTALEKTEHQTTPEPIEIGVFVIRRAQSIKL